MATLSLPGLSTGIDTATLVKQLMAVESRRLQMMQTSSAKYKEKQTAVNMLNSKLSGFSSSLYNISDTSRLKAFNATTSDDTKITAAANSNATEGSHTVLVKQLASAEREVHTAGVDSATSYLSNGYFIFSYNYKEMAVQTTDTMTLQDLVTKINGDPENPGVTASILFHDNKYHLVLAGKSPGSDNLITINNQNTERHESQNVLQIKSTGSNAVLTAKLSELSAFSGVFGTGDTIAITGKNHVGAAITPFNISVNQYSTVKDLLSGIEDAFSDNVKASLDNGKIVVTDKTSGISLFSVDGIALNSSTATLTISTISRTVEGGTKSILAAYNASTFTQTQEAKDAQIKVDGYPTGADEWISRQSNSIDDVIAGVTLNLHSTTGTDSANAVEVNTTRNTEDLKAKINAMIEGYNTVVMYLDETTKYDQEQKKTGILSADYSITSIRSLIKNPLLANASGFGSNDDFIRPQDIGLEIGADGMLKLNDAKFDEAVVENYQDVLALIGAQKTGLVSGTDAAYVSFYAASKFTEAGTFDVQVEINASGTITSAKIKTSSEDWSAARSMTIKGSSISGSSAVGSDKKPLYPEYDLNLTVDTSRINSTLNTTIQVKQGFAGALYETADTMLQGSTGRLPIAKKSITDQISQMDKRMDNEESRLQKVEDRLNRKFARLESLLTQIQQQMAGAGMFK